MPAFRRLRHSLLVLLRETQYVVTALAALAILWSRSLHSVYIAVGATGAAFLAKLLKRFIRQPRPEGGVKKTYGMPSTHSASISFFGTYLASLLLLAPDDIRSVHPRFAMIIPFAKADQPLPEFVAWPLATLVIIGATSVCWSRVYLGHHSQAQVAAGASLGAATAALALAVWIGAEEWKIGSHGSITLSRGVRIHAEPVERFADLLVEAARSRDAGKLVAGGRELVSKVREAL